MGAKFHCLLGRSIVCARIKRNWTLSVSPSVHLKAKNMIENLKKLIEKIIWKDLLYPAIFSIFLIIIIFVFVLAVEFFYTRIDAALSQNRDAAALELLRLDMNGLRIVADKLHVTIHEKAPEVSAPIEAPAAVEPPTPDVPPVQETVIIDPASIKVAVYNSTETNGLAGKLKAVFENAGFTVSDTGNKKPALETTSVRIKERLAGTSARETILSAISKSYSPQIENLAADNTFDIIVIIGAK